MRKKAVADSGDLDTDLTALLQVAGEAARARETVLVLFVDEMQYVARQELGALITALHRVAQRRLPVALIGSGLPQLVGHVGVAKSYAERMFSFPEIGPLPRAAAKQALEVPANRLGVAYQPDALEEILRITEGYPYFLQEWGRRLLEGCRRTKRDAIRRGRGLARRDRGTRQHFLPGSLRAHDPLRATLPAGHGRTRAWSPSLRGDRKRHGPPRPRGRTHPLEPDQQGDDLQPGPRGHGVHRTAVRPMLEADNARHLVPRGLLPPSGNRGPLERMAKVEGLRDELIAPARVFFM